MKNRNFILKISLTALFTALSYISFAYLKIPIPTLSGDMTALHLGNTVCVLAALILGANYGAIAGSLGMTIADILDPIYISSAPKTFILKCLIAYITALIAHRIAKINQTNDDKYILKWVIISSIIGLSFNVIFEPILTYFYKLYILSVPAELAKIMATWTAGATAINAFVSTILATFIYMSLRKFIKKMGLI